MNETPGKWHLMAGAPWNILDEVGNRIAIAESGDPNDPAAGQAIPNAALIVKIHNELANHMVRMAACASCQACSDAEECPAFKVLVAYRAESCPAREQDMKGAQVAETQATHRCKICGALWRLWQPGEAKAGDDGSWSLISPTCGKCCDNVAMGDQIEALAAPIKEPQP